MASAGGDENKRPTRIPKDMKGLLQFCVEQTKAEDPTNPSNFDHMSDERKQWLEKALKDMSISPVERMQTCIATIRSHEDDEEGIEKKVAALEELLEWVEQIDFAVDFHKIGGFDILPKLLHSDESELRWTCLEFMGTLVQNNPYCQAAVIQSGLVPVILQLLDKDENPTVRAKAMFAISCLCRDCPEAKKLFIEGDGFSVIMRALQSDVEKLKIKASFFLSHMCCDQPAYKDILCDIGMIEQLIGHLSEDHGMFHEHLMSALLSIVSGHSRSIAECQRPELNFHSLLKNRIEMLKNKEEFQEERNYATELLKIISSSDQSQDAEAR